MSLGNFIEVIILGTKHTIIKLYLERYASILRKKKRWKCKTRFFNCRI